MTDEELETALENGDPAIFTQGVSRIQMLLFHG